MDEEVRPRTVLGTIGTVVLFGAIAAVAVYGFAHATIRPIHPDQKTPSGHFDAQCSLCHPISKSAKLVED